MSKSRYQYEEVQMQAALPAVRDGMSKRAAAKQYNVPRTTINDKIAWKTPETRKIGKDTVLTKDEEESLVR